MCFCFARSVSNDACTATEVRPPYISLKKEKKSSQAVFLNIIIVIVNMRFWLQRPIS